MGETLALISLAGERPGIAIGAADAEREEFDTGDADNGGAKKMEQEVKNKTKMS